MNKSEQIVQFSTEVIFLNIYAEKNRKTKQLIQTSFMSILEKRHLIRLQLATLRKQHKLIAGPFIYTIQISSIC